MNRIYRGFIVVIIFLFLVSLSFGVNLVTVGAQTPAPASLATILTHIKVGWLKLASVEVTQILEGGFPVDEEFLTLSGFLLSTNGQPGLAREAYLRALNSGRIDQAEQATLLALIGRTYLDQRDYLRAKDYYEQALSSSGDQAFSLIDLGVIALREGELEQARHYLERAEKAGGAESARLFMVRGDVDLAALDYAEALNQYQKALKLAPANEEIYYRLKQVYQQMGNEDDWAALVEQAKSYGVKLK